MQDGVHFAVDFDGEDASTGFEEAFGECAGAWADFEDDAMLAGFSRVHDFGHGVGVMQEVLAVAVFREQAVDVEEVSDFFECLGQWGALGGGWGIFA